MGAAAATLFIGGTANAATQAQWDAVAQCESGGVWNIDHGDATSTGGLQIQTPTWLDYGGAAYAPKAYLATEAQQIAIAEKILAGQGAGAWVTITNGCAAPTATVANMHASTGGAPAPTPAPAPSGGGGSSGTNTDHRWHHHGSDGHHWQHATEAPVTGDSWAGSYTVKAGDSLSKIAHEHGVSGGWQALYGHNHHGNPNLIHPGDVLVMPS